MCGKFRCQKNMETQTLKQGTKVVPADFLAPCVSQNESGQHHPV